MGRKTPSLSSCWLTSGCLLLLPISQNSPRPQLTSWVQSSKQILCSQSHTRHQEQIGDSGTISINKLKHQALHLNRPFSLADLKIISKEGQALLSPLWGYVIWQLSVGDWARSWLSNKEQLLPLVKCHTPAALKAFRFWPSTQSASARWARATAGRLVLLPSQYLR